MELLIIIVLLAILAEVTFLVVKLPRQTSVRKQGRPILVDTSVLIDGRIVSVAKTGFIGESLIIPRSVVGELQFLADNADHEKRARARHGLDVVTELQNMPHMDVEILQDGSRAEEGVDERLLNLAKKYNAAVCTIDYNLNKVAVVEGIIVLNVNELAQSLRMAYLPGERMMLDLVQKGQDAHQAVGYLPDGTMVVVEHSSKLIGQPVEIEFIRSLQTAAGKMMFARRVEKVTQQPKQQRPQGKRPLPQQLQAPAVEAKPEQQPAVKAKQTNPTTVYHSDTHEQRRVTTQTQPKIQKPRTTKKPASDQPRSGKKPNDREATLLELVDKQK